MTHTLYRRGTVQELEHDYIIKSVSSVNKEGEAEKISIFKEIALKYHPVAMRLPDGSMRDPRP